jgi:S1-C subfamily serine protease
MFHFRLPRHASRLLAGTALAAGLLLAPPAEAQQDAPAAPRQTEGQQGRAMLGVIAAPTPNSGVLVVGVMPGGGGDEAQLQRGDFILAVDGQEISDPQQLIQIVENKQPGDKLDLTIWRNGEKLEREATLGAQTEEARRANRAWLGVGLSGEPGRGVAINEVRPQSPAAQAGLQAGDVLLALNGQKIDSVQQVIQRVHQLSPGEKVELKINRDGQEQTIVATLGAARDVGGPMFRRMFRPGAEPFFEGRDLERPLLENLGERLRQPGIGPPNQHYEHIEQMLEQMQRDINDLKRQLGAQSSPQQEPSQRQ